VLGGFLFSDFAGFLFPCFWIVGLEAVAWGVFHSRFCDVVETNTILIKLMYLQQSHILSFVSHLCGHGADSYLSLSLSLSLVRVLFAPFSPVFSVCLASPQSVTYICAPSPRPALRRIKDGWVCTNERRMAQFMSCTLRLWWGQCYATEEVGEEDLV